MRWYPTFTKAARDPAAGSLSVQAPGRACGPEDPVTVAGANTDMDDGYDLAH